MVWFDLILKVHGTTHQLHICSFSHSKRSRSKITLLEIHWYTFVEIRHYDPKTKNIVRDGGKSKTYHYYRCTNGKGAHKNFDNLHGEKIWEQFGGLIDNISISEEFAQDIADALNKTENKAHRVAELQIAEFKDKEKELQTREDKLLNLLLNNQIDQQAYERGLQLIRQNRDDITNQLEALQKRV